MPGYEAEPVDENVLAELPLNIQQDLRVAASLPSIRNG